MAHSLQGVYAPLPQSLSDSDSEKEVSMEPVCVNYTSSNSKTGNLRHFSSRQNGHPVGFNNINDNVHKVKRINPKMTALRKTAFVVSILLCFLPIIIFLWVLPCSESNTCPVKISNWETIQNNIELQGKINLVHGAFKNNLNLALRYKGSFNAKQTLKNGIMSFVGKNGAVAWDFEQESYPTEINCSIIDVNNNGYNDCLVIDERGLKAIDSVTGEAIWHVHSAQEISIREMDMPVKLIDINKDDVPELLAIYKKESFLLISGKDGVALSNIKIPSMCILISNLTSSSECIRYCCRTSVKIEFYEVAISDLEAKFKNAQKNIIPKKYLVEDEPNMIILGDRKLLVTNNGSCPLCRATISLYCTNNTLLRTWSYPNTYAMMPVPFTLQSSDSNLVFLLGHIKGFILKIWQWQEHSRKLSPTTRVHRSIPVHNDTYHLNQISESVMLIPFHENDIPIINISMTDIYLICNGPDHRNCQPDYEEQDNSLLIADLDYDKSIEVISYYSTFVQRDEDGYDVWYLVSKLKVFRLESELPKLYGIK